MTDDDLTRIEAQARGGGYNAATVNAERLALVAEVRRLRADLVHARMWATLSCDEYLGEGFFGMQQDCQAIKDAEGYCYIPGTKAPLADRDCLQHVTASDGWKIGQEVTP